jgi:hypothetical protein
MIDPRRQFGVTELSKGDSPDPFWRFAAVDGEASDEAASYPLWVLAPALLGLVGHGVRCVPVWTIPPGHF